MSLLVSSMSFKFFKSVSGVDVNIRISLANIASFRVCEGEMGILMIPGNCKIYLARGSTAKLKRSGDKGLPFLVPV